MKLENDSLKAQVEDEEELKEDLAEMKTLKEELNNEIKILNTKNKEDETKLSWVINREVKK